MEIHSLPSIEHYWSDSDDLAVRPIKNTIFRKRFQAILYNLHLADNTKIDSTQKDKLYKIKPLLDHFNIFSISKNDLCEYLCIDESMICFKGRSTLKQNNPMKPINRGYKL